MIIRRNRKLRLLHLTQKSNFILTSNLKPNQLLKYSNIHIRNLNNLRFFLQVHQVQEQRYTRVQSIIFFCLLKLSRKLLAYGCSVAAGHNNPVTALALLLKIMRLLYQNCKLTKYLSVIIL